MIKGIFTKKNLTSQTLFQKKPYQEIFNPKEFNLNLIINNSKPETMFNYGVGGQEVKQDASEAMADLAQNRTLFVQKLTQEDPIKPEMVYDLKTIEDVFEHFKPKVSVDFENSEGATKNETLRFNNLGDFSTASITAQSTFLQDLAVQQEQYQKIIKQLKTNKLMKMVIENADAKNAFLNAMQALIQELDDNK
ncbi:MAG TPA: hypothetical protein PLP23_10615 [Panacibacter sp.]|nr:hypothetical protein [Panacibacter sp.]